MGVITHRQHWVVLKMNWEKARETLIKELLLWLHLSSPPAGCGAVLPSGEHLKQTALPGSQGGEGGWIKGGGMNPKMENQITAQLVCLSQLPKAGDEDGLTA